MVACLQFINIIVHSVDDLNYRVFLQYEFAMLGLHDLLDVRHPGFMQIFVDLQNLRDGITSITSDSVFG